MNRSNSANYRTHLGGRTKFAPRERGLLFLIILVAAAIALPARAERPAAPKLLPERTLAYIRITDTPLMVERFRETALGRIGQDEEVKPLVSQLYASAQELWGQVQERVGLPLDQLLRIPQGEVCFAFVAPPEKRPGVVLLIDVKDQAAQARKLLAKGEEFIAENGGSKATENIDGQETSVFTGPDGNSLYQIERDGAILIVSDQELLKFILAAWNGQAEKTLADSDKFNAILSRCAGAVDDPAQLTYFVDPVEGFRTLARGSIAGTTLALLPVLGLDGVKGIGGSLTFSTGEFDQVQHMHLLLDNPRAGVVQLLAMSSGDTTPEPWVPADVVSYTTIHWDFQLTFDKAVTLYDSLTSEGELQAEVQRRLSERIGVDFEKELLPALQGRVTYASWVEKPVRINSIASLVGLKLKDPASFQPTLEKLVAKMDPESEKKSFAGVSYWTIRVPDPLRDRFNPEDRPNRPALRQPDPVVAIIGDSLVFSDSSSALQEAIKTTGDTSLNLASELDYKLIASKVRRQVGGDAPGMLSFNRPEQGMRFWFDLASSEETKQGVARRGENNPFFRELNKSINDNPLPPFAVIAKYLAPGGGMMVNDETGMHYTSFTLRRK